jgi:hypothetical protein
VLCNASLLAAIGVDIEYIDMVNVALNTLKVSAHQRIGCSNVHCTDALLAKRR